MADTARAGAGGVSAASTGTAEARTAPPRRAALDALPDDLLPRQGSWSDEDYLWLTDHSRRLIELTDGRIEELPLPTFTHQAILSLLHVLFRAWVKPRGGVVVESGLRMRIREGKYREPDLLLILDRADPRNQDRYWLGADLVAEVVSTDDPARDLVDKRADYSEAGIPEYWIVDPAAETITVLALEGDAYVEHGVYARGGVAASALLEGFVADVAEVFDAPESGA